MILDTNAVSALLSGESEVYEVLSDAERHELPVIVIGEYRYGILGSRHKKALDVLFEALVRESKVLAIDQTTASVYAKLRQELRKQGTPIPENDVWIAALGIQHNLAVVSRDTHFDKVQKLRRVSY